MVSLDNTWMGYFSRVRVSGVTRSRIRILRIELVLTIQMVKTERRKDEEKSGN